MLVLVGFEQLAGVAVTLTEILPSAGLGLTAEKSTTLLNSTSDLFSQVIVDPAMPVQSARAWPE